MCQIFDLLPGVQANQSIPHKAQHQEDSQSRARSKIRSCTLFAAEMTAPLPAWVLLDFACILRQIKAREINEDSFRSLQKAVAAAQTCLESADPLCVDFAGQVLAAVELECRLRLEQDVLLQGCR